MRHHLLPPKYVRHILSAPFIYSVLVPAFILDAWMEVYHRVAFALYGIPYVERSRYIRVDRGKLAYLVWYDKLNCMYCGYVNGLFAYVSEIAARTETYWCGIKHEPDRDFNVLSHQRDFIAYGDESAYEGLLRKNRRPGSDLTE